MATVLLVSLPSLSCSVLSAKRQSSRPGLQDSLTGTSVTGRALFKSSHPAVAQSSFVSADRCARFPAVMVRLSPEATWAITATSLQGLQAIFDETSWPDILTRHIGGLWKTLMTCNDHWYGDDFNEMALWQLWLSLVYIMCKIVQNHWYIIIKAKLGHYPYIGLYIKLLDFVDFAVQAALHS